MIILCFSKNTLYPSISKQFCKHCVCFCQLSQLSSLTSFLRGMTLKASRQSLVLRWSSSIPITWSSVRLLEPMPHLKPCILIMSTVTASTVSACTYIYNIKMATINWNSKSKLQIHLLWCQLVNWKVVVLTCKQKSYHGNVAGVVIRM